MVKRYDFDLDERQVSLMFAPLRTKLEVVSLLMKSLKVMLIDEKLSTEMRRASLCLLCQK